MAKNKNLKIMLVASEMVPYAKTGGLADVSGALSSALAKRKHQVIAVMPLYREVKKKNLPLKNTGKIIEIPISNRIEKAEIWEHQLNGVITYFIGNDKYYDRDDLYTTSSGDFLDNAERFVFFSKAVLKCAEAINFFPDIVHSNDWQSGLVPVYIFEEKTKNNNFWKNAHTIFTIHNLAYQGSFWHLDWHLTGLPSDYFTPEGVEFYGKINLLKAGIMFSDKITTVSPKYSREIQTEEMGNGLEGVLQYKKDNLVGILNGTDYSEWSPEEDKYIKVKYSVNNLSGKKICKDDLIKIMNLKIDNEAPLFGFISRLAEQKGVNILLEVLPDIVKMEGGVVILGKGEEEYHKKLQVAQDKFKGKIGLTIGFDNSLAHKIEAGCDMFLMPSKYEPCGLNQMYSLKYGTVPIVRATGGLDDTIKEFSLAKLSGNGFKFKDFSSCDMWAKIKKALKIYRDKKIWNTLVKNGMQEDLSWDKSAKKYEELYLSVLHL